MICSCGRHFDPPYVVMSNDDPVRKTMDATGQCWYCCQGIRISGSPPAVQPNPAHPEVAQLSAGRSGTRKGGGNP